VDATNAIDTTRATSALTSVVSASSSLALARYAMQFDGSGQVLLNTGTATNADPKTLVACFFNSAGAADTVIRFLFAQATSTSDRGKGMWMYTANGSVGWWDQAFGGLGQSAMPRNAWVCAMVGRGTDANKTIRAAWIPMTGGPSAGSALYQSGASEAVYAAGTYTGHRMIGRSYDLEQSSFPGSGFQGQVLSILVANVLYTRAQSRRAGRPRGPSGPGRISPPTSPAPSREAS
jgi:hypothetical protein